MSSPAVRRRQRLTRQEAKELDFDWKMVRGIFELARPWRRHLVLFAVTSAAFALIGTLPALVFKAIVDMLVEQERTRQLLGGSAAEALRDKNVRTLILLAAVAVGLYLGQSMLRIAQRWASANVGSGVTFTMRTRMYDHLQRMPVSFFTATQSGALMSRLNNDVMGAQRVLTEIISTLTTNAFTFVSTVVVMFTLDWKLTLVVLTAVPFFLVPSKYMGRVLQNISRERMDLLADMNGYLQERLNVSGATLNHLYGDPESEQANYERRAGSVRDVGTRTALVSGVFTLLTSMFSTCSIAIVYWVGGWRAITGGITVGTVVAFGQLAQRAYRPVNALSTTRIDLMTAMVSFERVFEVLEFENPVVEKPGAVALTNVQGRVEFDDVSFTYPPPSEATLESLENPALAALRARRGGAASLAGVRQSSRGPNPVLHNVSFVAEPGETVAFVGPTGAGKSTTLSLVARLADVSSGAVRIDGHDVRDLRLDSLRQAIGVVSQDTHLFHDTIRMNLLYANPKASDADLVAACELARIHDLIASLPDGYDTVAGERGYRMSGGEKQRLAIARMILKDPKIVVLDEATAHLDSHNERLIQEALHSALQDRTTLVIAHRLSTIVEADKIVVLERGRVVQVGSHAELVDTPGLYQDLHATQFAHV